MAAKDWSQCTSVCWSEVSDDARLLGKVARTVLVPCELEVVELLLDIQVCLHVAFLNKP